MAVTEEALCGRAELACSVQAQRRGGSMADNLKDRGPADRSRINVNEAWERRYWSKELGVSEDELRSAVSSAGASVDAVRLHLQKRKN
jgi:hypothetical protein